MNKVHEKKRVWQIIDDPSNSESLRGIKALSETLHVSELCAKLLYNRGYTDADTADSFLSKTKDLLHDPYLMKDMEIAVERLISAIENKERIIIYGDYDVDGVTSVTLLYKYLLEKEADAGFYIPSRSKEGYGLSTAAVEAFAEKEVKLIITVDTGITAYNEAIRAKELGVDLIVTDHHECHEFIPCALAVVNPHRPDCGYPFKELAGVGVVFKLICACEIALGRRSGVPDTESVSKICEKYLYLAAIGTVADVMPLKDENRYIVSSGLDSVERVNNLGLNALIDAIGKTGNGNKEKRKVDAGLVGFGIAPRINAAGRISSATIAVGLLLSDTEDVAKLFAEELCEINRQRQVEENKIADKACKMVEEFHDFENDKIIILYDDSWQQGIIGIVASRVTEKYGLPSILISFDGATRGFPGNDDIGKGSGRSVKGVNLVDALSSCGPLLERYGGHELAAGLSITRENIDEFKLRMNEYMRENFDDKDFETTLRVDCELSGEEISDSLVSELSIFEPYGVANPQPVFMMSDVCVNRVTPLSGGKHIKLSLTKNGIHHTAIFFSATEEASSLVSGDRIDILFKLSVNEFRGTRTVQLMLSDIRPSEEYKKKLQKIDERYAEIEAGSEIYASEDIIPSRDDIAAVYKLLRRNRPFGAEAYMEKSILEQLEYSYPDRFNFLKLRYIMRILDELGIISFKEVCRGTSLYEINNNTQKTSIDNSTILNKLRQSLKT